MALWDVTGKATGRAAHELLGGAVRSEIEYFGFPQGDTAAEIAGQARQMAQDGCEVIYVKVGRGDALDLDIAKQVRAAIGPDKRLRMDPNEHSSSSSSPQPVKAFQPWRRCGRTARSPSRRTSSCSRPTIPSTCAVNRPPI